MFDLDEQNQNPTAPAPDAAPAAPAPMMADPRIASAMQDKAFRDRLAARMQELSDAQAEGEARARRARLGSALAAFGGAIAGNGSPGNAEARIDAARAAPLAALKTRWDLEDAQQKQTIDREQAAQEHDPASDLSNGARAMFRNFNPGKVPDETLGKLSFAQLTALDPHLKAYAEAAKTAAETLKAANEANEVHPNAEAERAAKAATTKKTDADTAAVQAGTPFIPAEKKADINLKNAQAAAEGLKANGINQLPVGFAPAGNRVITPEDAKDFAKGVAAGNAFKAAIKDVRDTLNSVNADAALKPGETRSLLESKMAALRAAGKSYFDLKLNGESDKLMDEMFGDPTKHNVENFLGRGHNRARLDQMDASVDQGLDAKAKTYGIQRVGAPAAQSEQPKAPKAQVGGIVTAKNGQKFRATANGWEPVQG